MMVFTRALASQHVSDPADGSGQQLARKQLRLASAANDMDGFVEIELGPQG
jgi:hypothetical protein